MSQRRLISTLAVATAMTLSACGSDDDSPTADSAATLPGPTTEATSAPTEAPTPATRTPDPGATTMPTEETSETEPAVSLVLNPKITSPSGTPPSVGAGSTIPVPAEPKGDDVGRAIAHVRMLVDDPEAPVDLVVAEDVTWPDGAIGGPEPGKVYTQALVEGSRVVVRHDGIQYAYHRGGGRDLFWCPTAVLPT